MCCIRTASNCHAYGHHTQNVVESASTHINLLHMAEFVGPDPIVKVSVIRRDPRTVQPIDGHGGGEPLPALACFSARGLAIFV